MLGGAAPEEDIRISENMAALELAVRNRIPGAVLLEKLITEGSVHLGNRVKYLFAGVKDDMKFIKCEQCNDLFSHECLQKSKVREHDLHLSVGQIKGNFLCLVCFALCFDLRHLMGHVLMHSSV